MQYTLTYADSSITVSSLGAELQSLQRGGTEYLYQKKEGFWQRQSPVLFPIVGGLRDGKYMHNNKEYILSQHGFARDREFTLIQDARCKMQNEDSNIPVIASESKTIHLPGNSLTFQLVSDEQTRSKYPFDFALTITYILNESGLRVEYSVRNTGNEPLLFSIGGHPAFVIESIDECSIRFEGEKDTLIVDRLEKGLLASSFVIPTKEESLSPQIMSENISGSQKVNLEEISDEMTKKHEYSLLLSESFFEKDAMIFRELHSQRITLQKKNQKTLEFDRGNFPHFALWKQPNAPFLCLEPWQGYADSVDATGILSEKLGIISLGVGENMDFWWGVGV
ncbi:MAG: aldose 1-epimerase family protein [Candidatus Gracilibacteria bacterium]|nr:aldose 1-epimerase family protein [Candidatus Gracilibacteria bacterium]